MDSEENIKRIYGPVLPSNIQLHYNDSQSNDKTPEYFGPQLPPHLLKRQHQDHENTDEDNQKRRKNSNSNDESSTDESEREDDNNVVGPILPSTSSNQKQQKELEERALEIKIRNIDNATSSTSKDEKSREEWMTELPDLDKSGLGIFARQFRKRDGPDMSDRSIWTDTPNSKNEKKSKKSSELKIEKTKFDYEKDKEQDDIIKRHKKKHKRDKSLMELHEKKLKKEKKKKDKDKDKLKPERRPFNREEDLQVNRFDQARKQSIIKKAQALDTRFSSGKSKYL
ncbi:GPALPP motifs-containing protein 1-like isoform X1 [Condylostylus longicornis]|uniref:GPALPP motifs-containing protein 1-like isoform X1 n=1 Tax=Condylostylus longicornis TaxID=2530218 RepID=UPI00244E0DE8|nr:GPALPP motifs-containing protein 1-like isoform X1 [Condylostylus longicornis]XP_055376984.1 GPALPP motifs-containing protein 1-like isoform X1 [Condylostylus longicornis]